MLIVTIIVTIILYRIQYYHIFVFVKIFFNFYKILLECRDSWNLDDGRRYIWLLKG